MDDYARVSRLCEDLFAVLGLDTIVARSTISSFSVWRQRLSRLLEISTACFFMIDVRATAGSIVRITKDYRVSRVDLWQ